MTAAVLPIAHTHTTGTITSEVGGGFRYHCDCGANEFAPTVVLVEALWEAHRIEEEAGIGRLFDV